MLTIIIIERDRRKREGVWESGERGGGTIYDLHVWFRELLQTSLKFEVDGSDEVKSL